MRRFIVSLPAALLVAGLAACGGGGSAGPANPAAVSQLPAGGNQNLSVSPTSLSFAILNTAQSFTVSGGKGAISQQSDCAQNNIADVSVLSTSADATVYIVRPLTNGNCTIVFTDGFSNVTERIGIGPGAGSGLTEFSAARRN